MLLRFLKFYLLVTSFAWSQVIDSTFITFTWMSDTHIGTKTGAEDLRAVVNDIKTERFASFAIISGDISELDAGQNLPLAKTILDSMDIPYHIIPGNHDTKWSSSGGAMFSQLWGPDRFNFEIGEYRFIGFHQGPIMRMGDGYINPDDIVWVENILSTLTDPRQKIFIVMHYPLDPAVDNWYSLMEIIKPFNIQAVLHGHGHSNKVRSFEGLPGIMSRSTLSRGEQPRGYTLVHLYPDRAEFYERRPDADSSRHWYTLPLGDFDTSDSLRLELPDYSENNLSGVKLVWQISTGSIITSAATLDKNHVYVSNIGGSIYALDLETGEQLWKWNGSGAIHSTPAVNGSRLVFGSVDSTISCLSTADGKLKWQVTTTGPVLGSPLIHKHRIYIGSGDGIMRSLKLRNGRIIWEYSNIDGYIETRPVLQNERLMFGAWDGSFYALDAKKGKLLWKWSAGKPGRLYSPAACWPVAAHGKVFIVAPDRAMTSISMSDGETIWRKTGHQVREMIGISEDGETVFARTMNDTVFAIHSKSDEFQIKWSMDAGYDYDFAPSMMMEKDGNLFFGTKDGWVYCIDSLTGELIWRYRISDGLINTLTPVDANMVLSTAADGKLSLLKYQRSD
ncbi:PQQ-binding-like beta-propeller repeat protein [bacterium]|nr:PQQ-binding-like beta-propeller repeat protein [bacterium]